MKRFKANSYEAQLTREELGQVYEVMTRPGMTLEKATELVPRWKTGELAGHAVSKTTLGKVWNRKKEETANENAKVIHGTGEAVEEVQKELGEKEEFSPRVSAVVLNRICGVLAHRILKKLLKGEESPKELTAAKVLMKRQDQFLSEAKFRRETCEVFMNWYEDERARRILESRASAAEKLETLGKLIYGEEW